MIHLLPIGGVSRSILDSLTASLNKIYDGIIANTKYSFWMFSVRNKLVGRYETSMQEQVPKSYRKPQMDLFKT